MRWLMLIALFGCGGSNVTRAHVEQASLLCEKTCTQLGEGYSCQCYECEGDVYACYPVPQDCPPGIRPPDKEQVCGE